MTALQERYGQEIAERKNDIEGHRVKVIARLERLKAMCPTEPQKAQVQKCIQEAELVSDERIITFEG